MSEQNLEELAKQLQDSDERVRREAVIKIGAENSESVLPLLTQALQDPAIKVRCAAVGNILSLQNQPSVVGLVAPLLNDSSVEVRERLIISLSFYVYESMKRKSSITDSIQLLIKALKDSEWRVRSQVAKSFGSLRLRESVEPLIPLLNDSDEFVRSVVAISLGQIQDKRAIPALREVIDDPEIGVYAIGAITLIEKAIENDEANCD